MLSKILITVWRSLHFHVEYPPCKEEILTLSQELRLQGPVNRQPFFSSVCDKQLSITTNPFLQICITFTEALASMNIDEQPEVAPAAAEVPQEPTSKEENITSPKSESSATAVADSTTPVSVSQEPPKPKLCGICEKQAGKYKCPHCTFP